MKKNKLQTNKRDLLLKIASLTVALLAFIAAAAVVIVYDRTVTEPVAAHMRALNERAGLISDEYEATVLKLKIAKERYEESLLLGRRISLLIFDQCRSNLYDIAYPVLEKKGASAVFTVSEEESVGFNGCIDREQYRELCGKGWAPAIRAPEDFSAYDGYIAEMKERFASLDEALPEIFFFPRGTFDKSMCERILEDFKTVLFCFDDPGVSSYEFPQMGSKDGPVFAGYLYTSRKTLIRDRYLAKLSSAESCSICMGVVHTNDHYVPLDRLSLDTTVINVDDIAETVTQRTHYFRPYKDYRSEQYKVQTTYAKYVTECANEVRALDDKRNELYAELIGIYN